MIDPLKNSVIIKNVAPEKSFLDAWVIGNNAVIDKRADSFTITFDSNANQFVVSYTVNSKKEDFAPPLFGSGNVPGYLSKNDMLAIYELCKKLPNNGIIVEVGSFLGKSAVEFAKSVKALKKDFQIISIDSFNSPLSILHDLLTEANFDLPPGNNQFEIFKYYVRDYKNIRPLKAFVNQTFQFDQKINLVFEDSDHSAAALTYALPFWFDRLEIGGVLAGHDYHMPEVQTSVDTFAILRNLEVRFVKEESSIWFIEKLT
jgi:predicted O-methyltransferase YrrM